MRVIGAGFGRTGTTSLKAALQELGFGPSYTLSEVFWNPEHVRVWEAAGGLAGEEAEWEGFLADYEVAVDWPACSSYEELMEAFPGARRGLEEGSRRGTSRPHRAMVRRAG